jgi:hypothetical protein
MSPLIPPKMVRWSLPRFKTWKIIPPGATRAALGMPSRLPQASAQVNNWTYPLFRAPLFRAQVPGRRFAFQTDPHGLQRQRKTVESQIEAACPSLNFK